MHRRLKFVLITLAALLAVWATLSLGRWQLSRAAQKEAMQSHAQSQAALPVLDGAVLLARDADNLVYRRVVLRGRWLPEHTVYLDNRAMLGQVGFFVVTPLALEGSAAVVLVQRGWVARNFLDRNSLPLLVTPNGGVEVEGKIALSPSQLYQLGPASSGRIRQNLDVSELKAQTHLPLLGMVVEQTDAADDGLLRTWPPLGFGAEKNKAYAFQWFALSALIVILYVWFQIVRRFISPRQK